MDWLSVILIFGFLALFLFLVSAALAWKKKYALGRIFAVLKLLSAAISSAAWMYALKISGKIDWFLLGIMGYTPIGLIFILMLTAGAVSLAVNLHGMRKNRAFQV